MITSIKTGSALQALSFNTVHEYYLKMLKFLKSKRINNKNKKKNQPPDSSDQTGG